MTHQIQFLDWLNKSIRMLWMLMIQQVFTIMKMMEEIQIKLLKVINFITQKKGSKLVRSTMKFALTSKIKYGEQGAFLIMKILLKLIHKAGQIQMNNIIQLLKYIINKIMLSFLPSLRYLFLMIKCELNILNFN